MVHYRCRYTFERDRELYSQRIRYDGWYLFGFLPLYTRRVQETARTS